MTKWPPINSWAEVEWSHWLTQHGWEPSEIANYLDNDRFLYGVGLTATGEKAGPHNAYEQGVRWLFKPTPRGVTLHATRHSGVTNILWGGAVAGGKSMHGRWEAISQCLHPPHEGYRALIIRRELEELRRTHLDAIEGERRKLCEALGDEKAIKVTASPPLATFERTGAKIVFGFAAAPGDELRYLSEHYDLFHGDEATTLWWKQIVAIQARLRNDPKLGVKPRMILTTNPGGRSHQECVDHFITKKVSLESEPFYDPADFLYIPSSLYDTPHMMSASGDFIDYEKRLAMHDPARRRQLMEGDWEAVADQFFRFDPALHVRAYA